MPSERNDPLFTSPNEALTVSRAVNEARMEMVTELHRAVFGETWARPESPATVWAMLLDRIERRDFRPDA